MKTYTALVEFSTAAYVTVEAESLEDAKDLLENREYLSPDCLDMHFCDEGHDRWVTDLEECEE